MFALIDVRGRSNSGGAFEPFVNEGRDGYDIVEWLAKQPWCDGQVTMWGGSYDPLDMRPAAREQKEIPNNITDQNGVLSINGDGLVYHSDPFTEDTEITGYVKLVGWISMNVPDTDFAAEVDEVMENGTSIELTSDLLRARYRDSLTEERLVKPGEINRYEFDGFTFFSRRVAKGSRVRLTLTSPNSIQTEKNYNSGGAVAAESGKDALAAHVSLYHDAQHQSFLDLPIVK